MTVNEVISRFTTTPFLFAGAGITRRYYGLPGWEDLLKDFVKRMNSDRFAYQAFKQRAEKMNCRNGVLPMTATLIQQEFDENWYSNEELRRLDSNSLNLIDNDVSPFKAEIAFKILKESIIKSEYADEIRKLRQISKKNIAGVITTNYDRFFETIFEDYRPYIGQDELVFSPIQGIGEIYKIHGCVTKPETIIINDHDYQIFNEKSKYLAAKLMTIFMEYPIIFIGYSITDSNIRNILNDIVTCLPDEKLEQLQERFVFVEYRPGLPTALVSGHSLDLNGRILNMTKISTDNYSLIYEALSKKKAGISMKLLRRFKEELYTYAISSQPGPLLQVAPLEDPNISEDRLIINIGTPNYGILGLGSIGNANLWYKDIVTNEFQKKNFNYDEALTYSFHEAFKSQNGLLPVHKALSKAKEKYPEVEKRAAKNFDEIASNTILTRGRKSVASYTSVKELWEKEKDKDRSRAIRLLGYLPEEKMNLKELENVLLEIFEEDPDILSHTEDTKKSDIRRLIRYYDYLKWGKKDPQS